MKSLNARHAKQVCGLLAALVLAVLPYSTRAENVATQSQTPTQVRATKSAHNKPSGVEALIKHLHAKLKITSAQESLWKSVADVMRENADAMSKLAKARVDNAKIMTAVDDLKSYAEISEAHADGVKKLVPAFQALYDSMSDDQKRSADEEFRSHYGEHHHYRMH